MHPQESVQYHARRLGPHVRYETLAIHGDIALRRFTYGFALRVAPKTCLQRFTDVLNRLFHALH
jgi:hypothetical protein